MTLTPLHVVAAVMLADDGRVLLAQRPPGKHLAGLWEFPGGKLEPGETPLQGLARELVEELDIHLEPSSATTRLRVPWCYGERALLLDVWTLRQWRGQPRGLEGQALQWARPDQLDSALLAPADRAILNSLRLPACYPITPADIAPGDYALWRERLRDALDAGARLLQLRLPAWSVQQIRALAADLLPLARHHHAQLLLNADIDGALALGAGVGVQLKRTQLTTLSARPLPMHQYVGASCHSAEELALAVRCGADFATLSPVQSSLSHPHTAALGWTSFAALAEAAALPVYALGGLAPEDAGLARAAGAQGVAGIRGFWRESEPQAPASSR
jgi:8-oxo-dGTP diphosphatase